MANQTKTYLRYIEISNFKSYKGRTKIIFEKKYSAVIGANGSGKSNLLDAICFVLGQKVSNLRLKNISNLVYGSVWDNPTSESAYVKVCLQVNNEEIVFKRTINNQSSLYHINDEALTKRDYLKELEKLNILASAENFLIRQESVTEIAVQNAVELTSTIEILSGSHQLKINYNNLLKEKTELDAKHLAVLKEIRFLRYQKKDFNEEMEKAEKFLQLEKTLDKKQFQGKLFELLLIDDMIHTLEDKITHDNIIIENSKLEKQPKNETVNIKQQALRTLHQELRNLEEEAVELKKVIAQKKVPFIKIFEQTLASNDKLKSSKRTLEKALKERKSFENEIINLEKNIESFSNLMTDQSSSIVIDLGETQLQEYYNLRNKCDKCTAVLAAELIAVQRQLMSSEDDKTRLLFKKNNIKTELKKIQGTLHGLENITSSDKLDQRISKMELDLSTSIQKHKQYSSLLEKENLLLEEIKSVQELLHDARCSKDDYFQSVKKQDIIKRLQAQHEGVYGRLIDLCEIIHPKYNVAVTKIFKKNLDAIIVNTMDTGMACLRTLSTEKLGREMFLPLDSIRVRPILEHLRNMEEFRDVRLINDVILCDNHIRAAVLHVTKNAIICDSPETAEKVSRIKQINAISLNGTLYEKSGLISGGESDLIRKARRWDEKLTQKLKMNLENMYSELKTTRIEKHNVCSYSNIENMRTAIEAKLRITKHEKTKNFEEKENLTEEKNKLDQELLIVKSQIEAATNDLKTYDIKINGLKRQIRDIEYNIFQDFCVSIGINDIQEYEKGGLLEHKIKEQKRLDNKTELDRLRTILEYRKSQDRTGEIVKRWEEAVERDFLAYEDKKQEEKKVRSELKKIENQLEVLEEAIKFKNSEIQSCKNDLSKAESDLKQHSEHILILERNIEKKKNDIFRLKRSRHGILQDCKVNSIKIPFINLNTSIEPSQSTSDESFSYTLDREHRLKIDFSQLPEELRLLEGKNGNEILKNLNDQINSIKLKLADLSYRNTTIVDNVRKHEEHMKKKKKLLNEIKIDLQRVSKKLKKVKEIRIIKFNECFQQINLNIDGIYKRLTNNNSAQAKLFLENESEPFLGGVIFSCIPPNKKFMLINSLSGGEKSIASLALVFAMRAYKPAPFLLFDEIDCAFDSSNSGNVTNYFNQYKDVAQLIVISLNPEFYKSAEELIGVYPEITREMCSCIASIDLSNFKD